MDEQMLTAVLVIALLAVVFTDSVALLGLGGAALLIPLASKSH